MPGYPATPYKSVPVENLSYSERMLRAIAPMLWNTYANWHNTCMSCTPEQHNYTDTSLAKDIADKPDTILSVAPTANAGYAAVEIAGGILTDSAAAFADGIHSVADWYSHKKHNDTHIAEKKLAQEKTADTLAAVSQKRKLAGLAIAAGAAYSAAKGIGDIANPETAELNQIALVIELGAVSMNGAFYALLKRRDDESLAYMDAKRHHALDTMLAGLMSFAIVVNPNIPGSQGYAALLASVASMVLAYKTAYGKGHDHTVDVVE